jgi:hypothetical protein
MRQKLKPMHDHVKSLYSQCFPLLLSKHPSLRSHARKLLAKTVEWQYLTYRVAQKGMGDKEAVVSEWRSKVCFCVCYLSRQSTI